MINTTDEAITYLQIVNSRLRRQNLEFLRENQQLKELLSTAYQAVNQQLKELAATAYQVVGAADGPVELLDNLSAAANGHPLPHDPEAGLGWCPKDAWGN